MLPPLSNRNTPMSGETITKLIRQNYKPQSPVHYHHEQVQCRTDTICQKEKPIDYWKNNFHRRQANLQCGFNSSLTEPFKPIGGEVILDPLDLVLSTLPSVHVEKKGKWQQRRGTVLEDLRMDALRKDLEAIRSERGSTVFTTELTDTCRSAGYDEIKRLLRESRDRTISVKAGIPYEDHVRAVEQELRKVEEEANRPEEGEMVLRSVSSNCLPLLTKQSKASSRPSSVKSGKGSSPDLFFREKKLIEICEAMAPPQMPLLGRKISAKAGPFQPSSKGTKSNKVNLIQFNSGISASMLRKERQLRDHHLFLKSLYGLLNALHNMKLRDIRSKVPLSRELVERLQKEGSYSREGERGIGSRGTNPIRQNLRPRMSNVDLENENDPAVPMSMFGVSRKVNLLDKANTSVFGRRLSRNAGGPEEKKGGIETWEDLLNIQRIEYKEEPQPTTIGFQVGVVAKFMRWIKRASISPVHGESSVFPPSQVLPPVFDPPEKTTQENKVEPKQSHAQRTGSGINTVEKTKKLPIWQQVAQEKSTVFQNIQKRASNPDATIPRFRRNIERLRQSVQKESTAEIEKMVRERSANFHLKFGMLKLEECSSLFEKQLHRIQDVKDKATKARLESFDVLPSKWYEEIKERTLTLVSSYNQPQIMEALNKLQRYSRMDNKTVPLPKAKLCLLMMSLPAYDICQIHVQKALKLIFDKILLGQEPNFEEWLNQRKIPYMIVADTVRPMSAIYSPKPFIDA
ncbi:uncharacterized protein LOC128204677 [Mya arenaria]|uniref:uncharacterized protein LOC128204677 n=1 Tax=Mya arenaria TaxID=6604 RepID=UPI0022E138EE|nr:uncharacterized protein LOC128204677 [Mya arenaria]